MKFNRLLTPSPGPSSVGKIMRCELPAEKAPGATEGLAGALTAKAFRLVEFNEMVKAGDFVSDGRGGFEPWEGPSGFRADAFVKPIYRKCEAATNAGNGSFKSLVLP